MGTPNETHMSIQTVYSITGKVMIKDTETGKSWMSLVENDQFRGAIEGLYDFVIDTNASADMAYDWVCDQADIHTFVVDTPAWDMFYGVFDQARSVAYSVCA
jgi:hypothetical protein